MPNARRGQAVTITAERIQQLAVVAANINAQQAAGATRRVPMVQQESATAGAMTSKLMMKRESEAEMAMMQAFKLKSTAPAAPILCGKDREGWPEAEQSVLGDFFATHSLDFI